MNKMNNLTTSAKALFGLLLPCLLLYSGFGAARAVETTQPAIPFSNVVSGVRAEPVTPLDSFLPLTLEPQAITLKVRDLDSASLVENAPVHFEVTSITGTISASPASSPALSLSVTTDSTGAATVYLYPSLPLDVPSAVRATAERAEPLTFLFLPQPIWSTDSQLSSSGQEPAPTIDGLLAPANVPDSGTDAALAFSLQQQIAELARAGSTQELADALMEDHAVKVRSFLSRTLVVFTPLE